MLKDTSAGIVNRILMDLSLIDSPQAWLSDASLQLPAAIMVDVWKTAPFMALLLLAGLQTIPKDLYEAAAVDGASRARQFLSITLPLLRPTIAVALIFRTLDALRVFDLFNVLFGRQQLTMATYNYEMLVNNQRDGYASAISMIIFVLISVFAILYVRMLNVETE
jgi:trehalose/maltose transport system permease protein